jgi:hypothetical protein
MTPYSILIEQSLKGDTPKEKYESVCIMKQFLSRIAYPQAGTRDFDMTIDDIAGEIQLRFSMEELSGEDL